MLIIIMKAITAIKSHTCPFLIHQENITIFTLKRNALTATSFNSDKKEEHIGLGHIDSMYPNFKIIQSNL